MKMWGWVALIFACANAWAYDVQDSQHLLDQLDQYLGSAPITQAFHLGDMAQITIYSKDCQLEGCTGAAGGDYCATMCNDADQPMNETVTQLDSSGMTISLDDGTTESWTADQYSSLHGDRVRYILSQLDFGIPGFLETDSFADLPYTMPSGQVLHSKEIVLDFHVQGYAQTYKVRFTVTNELPAIGQIVQLAELGHWIYKLDSVSGKAGE